MRRYYHWHLTEKSSLEQETIKILDSIIISFIVIVLIFGLFVFVAYLLLREWRKLPINFCTPRDEVLQIIEANRDGWLDVFSQPDHARTIPFSTINGEQYIAINNWGNKPDFYVQVETALQEPYGAVGYASGDSSFLDHRYEFKQIDDKLFCYYFSGRTLAE